MRRCLRTGAFRYSILLLSSHNRQYQRSTGRTVPAPMRIQTNPRAQPSRLYRPIDEYRTTQERYDQANLAIGPLILDALERIDSKQYPTPCNVEQTIKSHDFQIRKNSAGAPMLFCAPPIGVPTYDGDKLRPVSPQPVAI